MVSISLKNITKTFEKVVACENINLDIKEGEFFTLLGPSGCGKTTVLRLLAGFYLPDKGSIFFDDKNITNFPPNKRETGMVFQNYALWPHMKVFDNVAYGLQIRKFSKEEIKKRVSNVLNLVQLRELENRTPFQLSGGQQQRVALARALVIEPKVLLLDEPLSNLDAKLRLEMRNEIMRIQKKLGITTVYVTHDQEEALSISDRIAILRNGTVQQVNPPKEVYLHPVNTFVADFIGQCSFFPGIIEALDEHLHIRLYSGGTLISPKKDQSQVGQKVLCAIRPENFHLKTPEGEFDKIECEIVSVAFIGKSTRLHAMIGELEIIVDAPSGTDLKEGDKAIFYYLIHEVTVLEA
ncbi:MAG: transporter ATP-binding protein [Thermoproteota archaeon]|nr:transporter ATP-binding protein [Thermoproteota archaeon]